MLRKVRPIFGLGGKWGSLKQWDAAQTPRNVQRETPSRDSPSET